MKKITVFLALLIAGMVFALTGHPQFAATMFVLMVIVLFFAED